MIILDGSFGEGGGALVRTALALSTLTGKAFEVTNIRAGRPKPGLKAQHLTAINALKEMTGAKTNEIDIGSTKLRFLPGTIKKGTYEFDIGTAGSISLFLQAVLPICLFARGKVTLKITGGTCGKWQASVDWTKNVLFAQLNRFVDKLEMKILRRGYYPKGGGYVEVHISPRLKDIDLYDELPFKVAKVNLVEQGKLQQIRGTVNVSLELQDRQVVERIARALRAHFSDKDVPISIAQHYVQSQCIGGDVALWAIFSKGRSVSFDNPVILGSDGLLDRDKKSEEIGKDVASQLRDEIESEGCVDRYLVDHILLYMGLLPGSCVVASQITGHAKTNMYVIEKFLPIGFKVEGKKISSHKVDE